MTIKLGKHVTTRRRDDGTYRVLFAVHAKDRPEKWPKQIALPQKAPRTGNLEDKDEVRRIRTDATMLNKKLDALRAGAMAGGLEKTLPAAAKYWRELPAYKKLGKDRLYRNELELRKILAWSAYNGHPDMSTLTQSQCVKFLDQFRNSPSGENNVRHVLHGLINVAIGQQWMQGNPLAGIKWPKWKAADLPIWTEEDVERWAEACRDAGEVGLACLIRTQFWSGQRLGDVREFKYDVELKDNWLAFHQSKTQTWMEVPLPPDVFEEIERVYDRASGYLFVCKRGRPFSRERVSKVFKAIRDPLLKQGEPILYLRALRHSCVMDMRHQGQDLLDIISVTGHSPQTASAIIRKYMRPDGTQARNALAARMKAKSREEEFSPTSPVPNFPQRLADKYKFSGVHEPDIQQECDAAIQRWRRRVSGETKLPEPTIYDPHKV